MFERRSLKLPIALGVTLIVLIVLLIVGWVLIAIFAASGTNKGSTILWSLLPAGIVLLAVVLVGVVLYLSLSIKAINLSRRQANFIDSVTHELKSPLASLKLYLQTLKRESLLPEQRENFRRIMLDDVERLDHMIDHLLDAGRHQAKHDEDEPDPKTELSALLARCVETESFRYHLAPEAIVLNVPECYVFGSHSELHIMFRNLIDNAIKYAGSPPEIKIDLVSESHQHVTVRIEDNGRGIPVRERRKIFKRFVRLGLELERDRPGTGLGLYIVRNIVRRLDGDIHVREPVTGSGSVFEVTLSSTAPNDELVAEPDIDSSAEPAPESASSDSDNGMNDGSVSDKLLAARSREDSEQAKEKPVGLDDEQSNSSAAQ